jgi:hypothetical protein
VDCAPSGAAASAAIKISGRCIRAILIARLEHCCAFGGRPRIGPYQRMSLPGASKMAAGKKQVAQPWARLGRSEDRTPHTARLQIRVSPRRDIGEGPRSVRLQGDFRFWCRSNSRCELPIRKTGAGEGKSAGAPSRAAPLTAPVRSRKRAVMARMVWASATSMVSEASSVRSRG